ncbi:MAG: hypothetical protein ABGZ17_27800, partial [Planctomycetaceae bacterium]
MTKGNISATGLSSAAANGDLILINGRPFSGDGTGYREDDPNTPLVDETATTRRLNEDYDAADLNNPWLAALSTVATQASWSDTGFFWGSDPVGTGTNRPGGTTPVVDNDADGIYESIWIDAGLPLQTQSDGTLVKPLVAMIVRDLDGRVNVNAHGSADQLTAFQTTSGPIGQGYGPAEIDPTLAFLDALGSGYSNPEQVTDAVLNSRHASATASDSDPGQTSTDDPLSAVAQAHQYGLLDDGAGGPNAFGIPHDIDGTSSAVANAITGQIEFKNTSGNTFTSGATNFQDDPYEMQLDTALGATPDDAPFTPDELERVFRHRDVDAGSLPDRLQTALTVVATDADKPAAYDSFRDLITTESWDLPVHPVGLPEEVASLWQTIQSDTNFLSLSPAKKEALQNRFGNPSHISDLIGARIARADDTLNIDETVHPPIDTLPGLTSLDTTLDTRVDQLIGQGLIDREMLAGLKFNVNRLFGNGQDDNNNDVVDEPGESGETAYPGGIAGAPVASHFGDGSNIPFSYGDASYTTSRQARQQYAKQLYLLLMLMSDMRESGTDGLQNDGVGSPNAVVPAPTGTTLANGQDRRRLLARRLAQFAVNAVDYRDADSIMTGFEYDANPFDGWDADGDLDDSTPAGNNDIGVVWGTEAPAAVLAGTLALHDLRLKDLGDEKTTDFERTAQDSTTLPDPPDPVADFPLTVKDEDYDQYAPPEGSLFLQIHALPNAYPTRDLFKEDTNDNSMMKLELSKTHNNTPSGDPVWRVAISEARPGPLTDPPTAGALSPVMNQLRDQDGSGDLSEMEETNSSWNPLTAIMPDSTDPAILKFRASGISDNDIDEEITLQRVVYFVENSGNAPPLDQAYVNQSGNDVLLVPNTSIVVGPRAQTDIRSASTPTGTTIIADVLCGVTISPDTWQGADGSIGMSVSEPVPVATAYYNDQSFERNPDGTYVNAEDKPFDTLSPLPEADYPIDQLKTGQPSLLLSNSEEDITDGATTVSVNRPQFGGTIANYCTAFLQRLADPTQAYHVVTNPYLTVDMMPIDLTVYNGDMPDPNDAVFNGSTNNDAGSGAPYTSPEQFVQRGWRERAKLAEPMGTLNASLTEPSASAITTTSDPAPFWPNRPFVSQYELLMVPASEPGKLSFELGTHSGDPQANFHEGFPHLL